MTTDRRSIRVYYDDLFRDYRAIYDDDAAFAAWVRLFAAADAAWPTPAELPRSVKPRALRSLTDSGLVILLPGDRYRIKGYDVERTQRQEAARRGAAKRWHSNGSADRNANASAIGHANGDANASANAMPTPTPTPTPTGLTRTPTTRGARANGPVDPIGIAR
jgi:hypothetical protein